MRATNFQRAHFSCAARRSTFGERRETCSRRKAFTLIELLVVIAIIAILAALLLPVLGMAKRRAIQAQCVSSMHQIEVAFNIYAGQYNDLIPPWQGGNTAWDFPDTAAKAMMKSGLTKKTFYCPGTRPRFTDVENWQGPNPSGQTTGAASTLWDYGDAVTPYAYHVIGYLMALWGTNYPNASPNITLALTNQNKSLQPEVVRDFPMLGQSTIYSPSDRVLMADVTVSAGTAPALPGYQHPENNYDNIPGGFLWGSVTYNHESAHLNGVMPAGGNIGYKDGHIDWRLFQDMVPRCTTAYTFWW